MTDIFKSWIISFARYIELGPEFRIHRINRFLEKFNISVYSNYFLRRLELRLYRIAHGMDMFDHGWKMRPYISGEKLIITNQGRTRSKRG